MHPRDQIAAVVRDRHVDRYIGRLEQLPHPRAQPVQSLTGVRGHENRAGQRTAQLRQSEVVGGIDLVDHQQFLCRPGVMAVCHLVDDLAHRRDLGQRIVIGAVDDMHQQVGVGDLFQCRLERLDQLGRQMPDESDGVGQDQGATVVELAPAGGGLQGGEQRVLHQHTGSGERIEQA